MKPIIGLLSTVDDVKETSVNYTYARSISELGGTPILLPYVTDDRDIDKFVELCDGFFFTGGMDVDPDLYGEECRVLVTRFDDVPYEAYISLVDELRAAGIVSTVYLGTKKFGKQIDFAVKDKYSHVIIMGGDELAGGTVKIKNLNTREETTVLRTKLGEYFGK